MVIGIFCEKEEIKSLSISLNREKKIISFVETIRVDVK